MRISKSSLAILLLLLTAFTVTSCGGQASAAYTLASESMLPDFLSNAPARVREAYRFAMANPHDLETVPCYCGCSRMGHQSNLNCFIKETDANGKFTFDDHASGCGICVDIAQDVMRMKSEGRSAKDIRAYIDSQYSGFGPSTNTPMPQ
jgi:uncharacterized protein with PCYCGC motif